MQLLTKLRSIKTLADLETADLPAAKLTDRWWTNYGRLNEPTSSEALLGVGAQILKATLMQIEEIKTAGPLDASHETDIINDLAVVRELKRRADVLREREREERKQVPDLRSDPVSYGSDGLPRRAGDADPARVDLGPSETLTSFMRQRGKLAAAPDLAGTSFGGVMRALVTGARTEFERKALSEGLDSAGGFTVPLVLLLEVIDAMRARAVTIRAGARTIPLETQKTSIARLATDPVAGWRAEGAVVVESDPTFEKVEFVPKSLAVLVKASRELIEDSLNVETALRNAFAGSIAVALDRVALRGTGTAPEPRGIANTTGVGSVSMTTNGAALVNYDPLLSALQLIADANAADATAAVMAPRTLTAIAKLKDTTNQPLRRPTGLDTLPFLQTTSILVNETQGAATTASRIITGDFRELLIGVRTAMRVELLRETFAGNLQYGFVAHLRADIALAHPASFAMVVGIIP